MTRSHVLDSCALDSRALRSRALGWRARRRACNLLHGPVRVSLSGVLLRLLFFNPRQDEPDLVVVVHDFDLYLTVDAVPLRVLYQNL